MSDKDETQDRMLLTAAHELGHWVAFDAAGYRVRGLRIHGEHDAICHVDTPHVVDVGYLVAIMAGHVAEARWLHRYHDYPRGKALKVTYRHSSKSDLRGFRTLRRRHGLDVSEDKAIREAEKVVKRHWGRIERRVGKLAEKGRLSSWSL